MVDVRERIKFAKQALNAFAEVLALKDHTGIERDAAIQRFEFSFEAVWKAAKHFLYEYEGIDLASPKGVIRSSREIGLLTDEETVLALTMADDRNLTVHAYTEKLVLQISESLPSYYQILTEWIKEMEARSNAIDSVMKRENADRE
ncbi:HI0074 family nucleotidyltransferase substrate-binding subunit [Thermicanus aegyptius]|uniref:HI0074 family nucleotidyltransferase substrate-binding subunit n=1 Tax=Thermicanus aegyptius TaxID=94009 RepID=UPI0003FFB210|nr:HI0074 family nucleotidyltransferase substrate-binding subunit [Thermicanus aegyptius]